jgi:hypothetical protein
VSKLGHKVCSKAWNGCYQSAGGRAEQWEELAQSGEVVRQDRLEPQPLRHAQRIVVRGLRVVLDVLFQRGQVGAVIRFGERAPGVLARPRVLEVEEVGDLRGAIVNLSDGG